MSRRFKTKRMRHHGHFWVTVGWIVVFPGQLFRRVVMKHIRNKNRRLTAMKSMAILPIAAVIGGVSPASAQRIVNGDQTLSGVLDGARGGGYMVQGGTLTINNGTLSNFRTVGGAGSGGGAGLGGAIFINNGATAVLNGVNVIGNSAVGGLGGTTSLTGGVLNSMSLPGPAATGTAGFTWEDNRNLVGDGNGNGLPGTFGRNGGTGAGLGGTGGRGGDGQAGWSENPTLQGAV
ncbi:MAG: hypothetical protein EON47_14790, partial [Acetobacteraceae bacterium]